MKTLLTLALFVMVTLALPSASAQVDRSHHRAVIETPAQRRSIADPTDKVYPAPVPSAGIFPISIGLVPPAQFPAEDWDVTGLRLNLFVGLHNNVSFIDLGVLGNLSHGDVMGLEIAGVWNQVNQNAQAIQVAGIGNRVLGEFKGLQLAGLVNYGNISADVQGLQLACINVAGGLEGIQLGLFNQAEDVYGLQLGVINMTKNMNGVQLGLFNVISDSNVPFMVLLNAAF
ncbi:MAG: hypothetical protein GX945_09765 [Lentisphaerae bacterium]|jgi:hypothetical protein|nr:hypothetical protein [Lentisphaerota bacterium]